MNVYTAGPHAVAVSDDLRTRMAANRAAIAGDGDVERCSAWSIPDTDTRGLSGTTSASVEPRRSLSLADI